MVVPSVNTMEQLPLMQARPVSWLVGVSIHVD